ncbi:MAG: DUF1203 domain-containing protein [Aeromicrobium sp.]|nr:DUF1203 domain-containing protein [Burkholderiales bacterium]
MLTCIQLPGQSNVISLLRAIRRPFTHLFSLNPADPAAQSICRVTADDNGFPCRISLDHTAVGETLLLLNYMHQPAESLHRASGPIYIRENVHTTFDRIDEVSPPLQKRTLSLRADDKQHMAVDAEVCDGSDFATLTARFFERADAMYLHAHYAKRGCFTCRA